MSQHSNDLSQLFDNNRAWADAMRAGDREFFSKLAHLQAPQYLWIGCSDSRVSANEITGLMPGEVFVHRNVGNVVVHTDLNCLSVMQFAIDVLKVRHVMVVGHYGCGGVKAALEEQRLGLVDNWLRHIQDVHGKHRELVSNAPAETRVDRLCELNVVEQVVNVAETTIVRDAWARGQTLAIHGWIYRLSDGLLRDVGILAASAAELQSTYASAVTRIARGGC